MPVSADRVWDELRDLGSHPAWMDDAVSISFDTSQRQGVGTRFVCLTRVGPIRLRDRMTVTQWVEGRRIGIEHRSRLIRGKGTFVVHRRGRHRSRLVWKEHLRLPLWLGGRLTGFGAGLAFHLVARRNLRNLRELVSAP